MTEGMHQQYTAIIADDHAIVRDGLRVALEKPGFVEERGIRVVAEAADGLQTIEKVKLARPDLLLLDISMPHASGAEILTEVRRWSPDTKIVIVTAIMAPGVLASLVDDGVDGIFSKAGDNADLYTKLPLILRGGRHVEKTIAHVIGDRPDFVALSARERQTLNMIIAG
ncbi:MAG: response regulator transcription factor, partial [Pseudomonadota bacterium]